MTEIERQTRHALCSVLDRLGADGAATFHSDMTNAQVDDEIWQHVQWLEIRAKNAGIREAAGVMKSKKAGGWVDKILALQTPES